MFLRLILIITFLYANFATEEAKDVEKKNLPKLYYFSSPTCPACAMMAPILDDAKVELKDKLDITEFRYRSPERTEILKKFMHKVDLNYVPTWILTDDSERVYTSGKGFVPKLNFFSSLSEGLNKIEHLKEMKLNQLIFICETGEISCKDSESAVEAFLEEKDINLEKVDVAKFKSQEEWKAFFERINHFRYMQDMEYIPALIALSDKNEMIELIQKGFSKTEIEKRLKGFY